MPTDRFAFETDATLYAFLCAVKKGDRIAQLICERIYAPELEELEVHVHCLHSLPPALSLSVVNWMCTSDNPLALIYPWLTGQ